MLDEEKKVGIIGAGLSGLSCAKKLSSKGFKVTIFDKNVAPGGRIKTDIVNGFILDHGFQVYLPAYPTGKKLFDYKSLDLRSFGVGAWLKSGDGKFSCLSDPIRNPVSVFRSLVSDKASFKDKLLMLKMKITARSLRKKEKRKNRSSLVFLKDYGFSDEIIYNFFKPFFSGVFLEEELDTPSHYFLYLFRKFSKSRASIPAHGMGELTKNLMEEMRDVKIRLGSEVLSYDENKINTSFESIDFDYVVVAGPFLDKKESMEFNSVTTYYFKTKSTKFKSKYLYLCDDQKKHVNHVACMTAVSEEYAPKGWQLFSVNVIGDSNISEEEILADLKEWFGEGEISKWSLLKKYVVKRALPRFSDFGESEKEKNGVYFCGDYMESPSIEGALFSGVALADLILKKNH